MADKIKQFKQFILEEIPDDTFITGLQARSLISNELTNFTEISRIKSGLLQSGNFVKGSTGWRILATGDVEFNKGTFRGDLIAGSIHIPDQDTTANSFHTNSSGDSWWGATETNFNADNDNANAFVLKTGVAKFQSITIGGGTIDSAVLLVVTTAGTIEGRVNAPFNKFYLLGNQNDGLATSGTGTHTETREWDRTRLSSTSVSGQYSRLTSGGGNIYNFGTDCEVSIEVKFADTSNQSAFWGINGRNTPSMNSDGEFAGRQVGFVIDTSGKLYATNGDGTTQKKTEITGITITNFNRYRLVFDAGTDVKFYVNETLKVTHTVNLPIAVQTYGPDFMTKDFGNSAKFMDFFNSYVVIFTKP